MIMKNTIKDLIDISQYAGSRADYTQGGGGNTSVKNFDNGAMLIKASGYRLVDINENTAFVAVDKNKIENYYNSVDLSVEKDYEKESAEISKNSVIAIDGMATLRPSVEVGFHAILKKYVIHTHSVYANLLTCSQEGESLAEKLFSDKDFGFIFLFSYSKWNALFISSTSLSLIITMSPIIFAWIMVFAVNSATSNLSNALISVFPVLITLSLSTNTTGELGLIISDIFCGSSMFVPNGTLPISRIAIYDSGIVLLSIGVCVTPNAIRCSGCATVITLISGCWS